MAYENTINKTAIRQKWDSPLLESWTIRNAQSLAYFGLSGPRIHDLLDWRPLLRYCTCIESPGHTKKERETADETIGMFHTSIHFHRMSAITQLLLADVEDVILEGTDQYGYKPAFSHGAPAHKMRFDYDLVNLDFDGGLGYTDNQGASRRVSAIKKLFERQEGHSFILLLTINVRGTLTEEIQRYLEDLRGLGRGGEWQAKLDWYLARGDGEHEYKLKAAVPSFIRAIAEARSFRCYCYPPVTYVGHRRAHMVHFAFELTDVHRNLPGVSAQDDLLLVDLPLLTISDGRFSFAPMQHPGFDVSLCGSFLDFLPTELRTSILSTLGSRIA